MEDVNLRLEFHRALDAVAPPAPWLADHVRRDLRRRRVLSAPVDRARRGRIEAPATWLLPIVAALLTVAIVVTLVVAGRELRPHSVPVKQPQQHGLAGVTCPSWAPLASLKYGALPDKMTSPTTGWAAGDLRTTDGGRNWYDVSPASFRADVSVQQAKSLYPPGYADSFLDSGHAWFARPYPSSTSCFDHINVFMTSDGGQTWQESAAVTPALQGDTKLQMQLDFTDAQHGWLMVLGSGRIFSDEFLYSTADGGRDWRLVSQLPSAIDTCSLQFSSLTTGWLGACGDLNSGGMTTQLTVTRDGGATWTIQQLPTPPHGCGCSAPVQLTFIDAMRGVFLVYGYSGVDVFATSDGGQSWHALSAPPGYPESIDLEDANNFWILGPQPGWMGKGAPTWLYHSANGGVSWTLVHKNVPIGLPVTSLQFVDPIHGFAVVPSASGQGSQVLTTSDGGHTWTVIKPEVS